MIYKLLVILIIVKSAYCNGNVTKITATQEYVSKNISNNTIVDVESNKDKEVKYFVRILLTQKLDYTLILSVKFILNKFIFLSVH